MPSKTTQGLFSVWSSISVMLPMSASESAPRTTRSSSISSARRSHSRRPFQRGPAAPRVASITASLVTLSLLFPQRAQHLFGRDWQVGDADADGVVDGVGDHGHNRGKRGFANTVKLFRARLLEDKRGVIAGQVLEGGDRV